MPLKSTNDHAKIQPACFHHGNNIMREVQIIMLRLSNVLYKKNIPQYSVLSHQLQLQFYTFQSLDILNFKWKNINKMPSDTKYFTTNSRKLARIRNWPVGWFSDCLITGTI
jgi:hypothetical protein